MAEGMKAKPFTNDAWPADEADIAEIGRAHV